MGVAWTSLMFFSTVTSLSNDKSESFFTQFQIVLELQKKNIYFCVILMV